MIGSRLKRAREATGLSLRDVESAIEGLVTAQAIGKYERNEMMPGSAALLAMANALQVSPEYLLSEREVELVGVDFRKNPHTNVTEEKAVEASVLDRIERYLTLEEILPESQDVWKHSHKREFSISSVEDAELAADTLRAMWKIGIDPIPCMTELLEDHGIKVVTLNLPEKVSGSKAFVRRPNYVDVPVIVVNRCHRAERQRFTLAHELAHLVMHFQNGVVEAKQEKAADRFAGAFLIAKQALEKALGRFRTSVSLGELVELKKLFKVSIPALVVRCYQLKLITAAAYGRLWAIINKQGWNSPRSNEPIEFEKEEPKRFDRLCLRAVVEGVISIAKGAELLNVSMRELDKRLVAQSV